MRQNHLSKKIRCTYYTVKIRPSNLYLDHYHFIYAQYFMIKISRDGSGSRSKLNIACGSAEKISDTVTVLIFMESLNFIEWDLYQLLVWSK